MCGRATLATPPEELARLFGLEPPGVDWPARYNIAPTEPVAVIRAVPRVGRVLGLMRWGMIPSFAKDASIGARMINARVESLTQRDAFRSALASRRCIVVVDGFYEWTRDGSRKTPHYVKRSDGRPMPLAGLWDTWRDQHGHEIESCTIVTVPGAPPVSAIHDRMPLLVPLALIDSWLDPSRTSPSELARVLDAGIAEGELVTYGVDPRMNSSANDGPENIVPFELQRTLFG